jgi:hypothetical protein
MGRENSHLKAYTTAPAYTAPFRATAQNNNPTAICGTYTDAVRDRVSSDPLGAYALVLGDPEFVRRGREYAVRCPFHRDRHPSLRINPEKRTWFCDVCGRERSGDVIDLYGALHDLNPRADFPRLVEELGALLGVVRTARSDNGRQTRHPRRLTAHERLVAEIAQAPVPITPPPPCCLAPGRCEHWDTFDREYPVAVLRDNIAIAIGELAEKAARGVRYDLEPRPADLPLDADELIAGVRFAIAFGAIVPAGIPDFVVERAITEAIDSYLSGEADHAAG